MLHLKRTLVITSYTILNLFYLTPAHSTPNLIPLDECTTHLHRDPPIITPEVHLYGIAIEKGALGRRLWALDSADMNANTLFVARTMANIVKHVPLEDWSRLQTALFKATLDDIGLLLREFFVFDSSGTGRLRPREFYTEETVREKTSEWTAQQEAKAAQIPDIRKLPPRNLN